MALILVGAALLIGFGAFGLREWRAERQQLVESRVALASVMAANVSGPLIYNDRATAHRVLRSSRSVSDVSAVVLFDEHSREFAREGAQRVGAPAASRTQAPVWKFAGGSLDVRVPVRVDGQPIGELLLVSSLDGLHRMFLGYALFAALVFLAVVAAAIRASTALANQVIQPVRRLSAAMQAVRESGDFAQPVHPGRERELAKLSYEFNALLAELARRNAALIAARDAADAGNRAKTEFLANMSHEVRTPLNAVVALSPLLRMEPLTDRQRGYLDVIERSADSLLELLKDVLDAAKLEAGRVTLEAARFDMRALVADASGIFRALAHGKGLGFHLVVAPDLAAEYVGDPLRVKQIVTNLLSNAVKFTPAGEVRVSLQRDPGTAGMLRLSVADTGVGIPEDRLDFVFDKFVQADLSTTREFGGSGLGLAICRDLAELMGGGIAVQSRPGQGATFVVRLALEPATAAAPSTISPTKSLPALAVALQG